MSKRRNWQYINREDGKPITVDFQGFECHVVMERYQSGGLSLRLIDAADPCPVCRATSNLIDSRPAKDEVFIKNYGENEGVFQVLTEAGLLIDTGKTIETGHSMLNVGRMSQDLVNQWQAFEKQLSEQPGQDTGQQQR